jgi:hypothetical protein
VLCKKAARRGGFHVTSDNFSVRLCPQAANVHLKNVPVNVRRQVVPKNEAHRKGDSKST